MKAWYFSQTNRKLRYNDNRLIHTGRTHKVTCEPILCKQGLHGSKRIIDALLYAPGECVWRVDLAGKMDTGSDKIAATERKYLWGYNATDVLGEFSRKCALDVIHLWDAPQVVIDYLKTGDESIGAAAMAAARDAARDAAWDAAGAAAMAAAGAATRDATRAAARDAAWDAAWDAAMAAAGDAAWEAARAAAMAAAGDATLAAAMDAELDRFNNRLYRMILKGRP